MDINIAGGEGGALPSWLLAVLPLAGVCLGSFLTSRQQNRQLKHDAEQRGKDRASALRKNAVLHAVDAYSNLAHALAAAPEHDGRELDEAQIKFNAAMMKLQLVGGSVTAKRAHELSLEFSAAILTLNPTILEARGLRDKVDGISRDIKNHESAVVRLTQQISSLSQVADQHRLMLLNELDRQRGIEAQLVDVGQKELAKEGVELRKKFVTFYRDLFKAVEPINAKIMAILNDIRIDLDVNALDSEAVEAMRQSAEAMQARLLEWVNSWSSPVDGEK